MEMPPDTPEAVGVNELFVAVTVDASFTTEQAVVGRTPEEMKYSMRFVIVVSF